VPRVIFDNHEDLELFERAARELAARGSRDAQRVKGTSVEGLHLRGQASFLDFAERLKAARNRPDAEPPPSNVRPIRS